MDDFAPFEQVGFENNDDLDSPKEFRRLRVKAVKSRGDHISSKYPPRPDWQQGVLDSSTGVVHFQSPCEQTRREIRVHILSKRYRRGKPIFLDNPQPVSSVFQEDEY